MVWTVPYHLLIEVAEVVVVVAVVILMDAMVIIAKEMPTKNFIKTNRILIGEAHLVVLVVVGLPMIDMIVPIVVGIPIQEIHPLIIEMRGMIHMDTIMIDTIITTIDMIMMITHIVTAAMEAIMEAAVEEEDHTEPEIITITATIDTIDIIPIQIGIQSYHIY